MIDLLTNIKEQLFDAPSEVKKAFNTVVSYFDTEYFEGKGKGKGNDRVWVVGILKDGEGTLSAWSGLAPSKSYSGVNPKDYLIDYENRKGDNYKWVESKEFPAKIVMGGKGKMHPDWPDSAEKYYQECKEKVKKLKNK